ncbi:MAG: EpsG family protein [Clostridia bacterium]|nr:EpsG family protein [Clostridia bacterium]
MTKLIKLLAAALIIAFCIDRRDNRMMLQNRGRRERFFTFALIMLLAVFCGLRTWYNDTGTYREIYTYLTPELHDFTINENNNFAHGIGFAWCNSLMKTWGFSSQDYLMVYAFITVIPYVLFVRKYSASMAFGVFLMFATGFYTFSFAAIKQCAAIGFCLLAVSDAVERKWFRFLLCTAIGSLFHPYAIVYLIVPFLFFKPWTGRTYFFIAAALAVGFSLESLLGTIVDITTMMGADYDMTSFVGEGVNIFRALVAFVPLMLSIPYRNRLFSSSGRTENLMFNLAMMNALFMFVGLFGSANYFARLANYVLSAQVIVLPWMLSKIGGKEGRVLKMLCVVGYCGYFAYGNMIQHVFDYSFSQMPLSDYLLSHF